MTLKDDKFLINRNLATRIIEIYTTIMQRTTSDTCEFLSFHLLYTLEQRRIHLFPAIKQFLDITSNERYEKTNHHYSFQILSYLNKFWADFPEDAAIYLIRILDLNPFLLYDVVKRFYILDLLRNLLTKPTVISDGIRNRLMDILAELVKSQCPTAANIMMDLANKD